MMSSGAAAGEAAERERNLQRDLDDASSKLGEASCELDSARAESAAAATAGQAELAAEARRAAKLSAQVNKSTAAVWPMYL